MRDRAKRIIQDTPPLLIEILANASRKTGEPETFVMSTPALKLPIDVDAVDAQLWERDQVMFWSKRWGYHFPSAHPIAARTRFLSGAIHHVPEVEVVRLLRCWEQQRMRHLSKWPLQEETVWVDVEEASRLCDRSVKTIEQWVNDYRGMVKVHPVRGALLDVRKLAIVNDRARRRNVG